MNYKEIVSRMSLEDKIALCSGADFWHTKEMVQYGIPKMMLCDGPHGLRKQEESADMLGVNQSIPATSFPTAVTTGSSWDPELLATIGAAIAKEAAAHNVGVVLGPGLNIKRNPLCGRNFEYISEDPFLSGKMGAAFIKGVQNNGIGACVKHFACNNQEWKRFSSDSILDERTLREIYLSAFEIAVKEGQPATVMSAYNKINGTHCSDNKSLLTHILRDEWGFDGLVVTDWGGMNNRIEGFRAGCDLVMPGGSAYMEKEVLQAVKAGQMSEELIDASAERVLAVVSKADHVLKKEHNYDVNEHHNLAKIAAEQSAVLLKNEGAILPLEAESKIGLIGSMAKEIRYQGAGSSHINPTRLVHVTDVLPTAPYVAGCSDEGDTTEEQLKEALTLAKQVDVPIVFAGLTDRYESEGFDRENMMMPEGHHRLITAVAEVNPNTVVVLMSGSVVEVPWIDKVKAVLYMALPGQAGGEAVVNLLYGKAVPSGKLAETWPMTYEDCVSSSYYHQKDAHYREGIYVGYRYYDKAGIDVRFPFGYGLSYTSFQYSNLKVETICERDHRYKVTLDVTNSGQYEGADIVQLYVAPPRDAIYRPVRELKGFTKLSLKPGETKQAVFHLNKRNFAIWHEGWKVAKGTYYIQLGHNSRDIPLEIDMHLEGEQLKAPIQYLNSWYENPSGIPTHQGWEQFLGRSVIEKPLEKGKFTMSNTVNEMKDYSLIMKIMYKAVERTVAKGFGGKVDYNDPAFRMVMASSADSSLTAMKISGAMRNYILEGLLEMANGRYLKGIKYMLKRYT